MKIKIKLFTTPGCEACKIMNKLLNETINNIDHEPKDLDLEVISIDTSKEGLKLQRELNIYDFPNTRFYVEGKDDEILNLCGTYPVSTLADIINKIK